MSEKGRDRIDSARKAGLAIGKRRVGQGSPTFVIAEAGINHNGSPEQAMALIDAAADAGCDAVKFQKRCVRALLSREAYQQPYCNGGNSFGETYGAHRERLELDAEVFRAMAARARERAILFMASPWDAESAEFVESLGVLAHKIGSPDLTNLPLSRQVACYGKPVLLSTGMSAPEEVDAAVREILEINSQLILLHCVSIYPTPFEELRLGRIVALREKYGLPVGFSGHEGAWHAAIAAVALGACVIEKHITLDRSAKGGDHRFSLEPDELALMVRQIRETEAALALCEKPLLAAERPARRKLSKSVTARLGIPKGAEITAEMLTCKSPATGFSPLQMEDLLGRRAAREIPADTVIGFGDLEA